MPKNEMLYLQTPRGVDDRRKRKRDSFPLDKFDSVIKCLESM